MRDVVITRVQHSGRPRGSRNLEEWLTVRFPGAWRTLSAVHQRLLSPRSRLRRTLVRRSIVSGWDAASRRDYELMLVRYAPDVEFEYAPEFEALGLGGTFRGHDGMLQFLDAFDEAWEGRHLLPALILDLGDRLLVLGTVHLPGTASGPEFEPEFAQLILSRGGLAVHEQEFLSWEKGLRAAGLDPKAIALPGRARAGEAASSTW
jgi:ketosteroid isomerase-like protein